MSRSMTHMQPDSMKMVPYDEWIQEGERRFGKDQKQWGFKCCNCGHVQCMADFEALSSYTGRPETVVFFSCIGRWSGGKGELGNGLSPCNYTLGGLFKIHKLTVVYPDGEREAVFEFAEQGPETRRN